MLDMNDLMAEMTRFFLAFLMGMLIYPLCYWLGARRNRARRPGGGTV